MAASAPPAGPDDDVQPLEDAAAALRAKKQEKRDNEAAAKAAEKKFLEEEAVYWQEERTRARMGRVYAPLDELVEALHAGSIDTHSTLGRDIVAARMAQIGRQTSKNLGDEWRLVAGITPEIMAALTVVYARRWAIIDFILQFVGLTKRGDIVKAAAQGSTLPGAIAPETTIRKARDMVYSKSTDDLWRMGDEVRRDLLLKSLHMTSYNEELTPIIVNRCSATVEEVLIALQYILDVGSDIKEETGGIPEHISLLMQCSVFLMSVGGDTIQQIVREFTEDPHNDKLFEGFLLRRNVEGGRTGAQRLAAQLRRQIVTTSGSLWPLLAALEPALDISDVPYLSAVADGSYTRGAVRYLGQRVIASHEMRAVVLNDGPDAAPERVYLSLDQYPVTELPDYCTATSLVRVPPGVTTLAIAADAVQSRVRALRPLRVLSLEHGVSGRALALAARTTLPFASVPVYDTIDENAYIVTRAWARREASFLGGAPYTDTAPLYEVRYSATGGRQYTGSVLLTEEDPHAVQQRMRVTEYAAYGGARRYADSPALDAYFHAPWSSVGDVERVTAALDTVMSSVPGYSVTAQSVALRERARGAPETALAIVNGYPLSRALVEPLREFLEPVSYTHLTLPTTPYV